MHVIHTAGDPPKDGNMVFAIIGWIRNSRKDPIMTFVIQSQENRRFEDKSDSEFMMLASVCISKLS